MGASPRILFWSHVQPKVGPHIILHAIEGCHESVVRLLLDKGAEVNAGNNNGRTPLYLASYSGHESVVRLLRDRGGR